MVQDIKIGFIGMGDMGRPMAKKLVEKGFSTTVYDLRKEFVEELKASGAIAADSCRKLAEVSDVVIILVRTDKQVEEVLYGKNGVWEGIRDGSTIIISSTIDPLLCQKIASAAEHRNIKVLDAAVSGSRIGAESGTLTFMVGGDKGIFDKCRPIFEAMGKNIFYLGGVGMGEFCKLANNLVYFINLAGLSEGIALGLKAGIQLESLLNVINVSTGSSWHVHHWDFVMKLKKEYDESKHSSVLGLLYKDMDLALKRSRDMDLFLPLLGLCSQLDASKFFTGLSDDFKV
jgi:3-hydroxyisobutyrate dehydrogenase